MNSQTLRSAIATGACAVLGISLSVALGVVPRVAGDDSDRLSATNAAGHDASLAQLLYPTEPSRVQAPYQAAPVRHAVTKPTHSIVPVTHAVSAHADSAHVVSAVASTGSKTPATHHKKKAHHGKKAHKKHHKKHSAPSAPKPAIRTTPTQTAVSNAIAGLKKYVHTPFSISSSQVAQFGDQVCGAFDDNSTYAQVKNAIMEKVKQIPFTTVAAGAADYVVKTAVKLYCPGYTSRTS